MNPLSEKGIFVFTFALMFCINGLAQYNIQNSVLGNGGAVVTDAEYTLASTIGQSAIDITQDASNINQAGFWYQSGGLLTIVEQNTNVLPAKFRLDQNFPNPFNPTTTIRFAIPEPAFVTLKLYDLHGREVVTLVNKEMSSGEFDVIFDATGLASGVYFYRIQTEEFTQFRKLMLLK